MKPMNRMHCPHCQSRALTSVVETEFDPRQRRSYWVCADCGRRFRSIQNLEEELSTVEKFSRSAVHAIALLLALCLLSSQMVSLNASVAFYGPILLIAAGLFLLSRTRLSRMESECTYLKQHCFC